MRTTWGLVAAAAAIVLLTPAPAAAAPVKGAYYAGTVPGSSEPSFARVSADGKRLTRYLFNYKLPCSDGRSRGVFRSDGEEPRWNLAADGSFDHRGRPGRTGRTTFSDRYVGAFAGDQVTLTATARYKVKADCAGDVAITLRRVGSPLLAGSDSVMTTGPFGTARRRGLLVSRLRTVGPARFVENGLRIRWRVARCSGGGTNYRDSVTFFPLIASPAGRVSVPFRDRYRIGSGLRAVTAGRLKLRFTRRAGRHRVTGSFRARSGVYRGGRKIDTCRFSRSFSATARR